MYTREITSENTYTLAEARRIIKAEQEEKREALIELLEVNVLFVICIVMTILYPVLMDGNIAGWFVLLPASCYFITKANEIFKRLGTRRGEI